MSRITLRRSTTVVYLPLGVDEKRPAARLLHDSPILNAVIITRKSCDPPGTNLDRICQGGLKVTPCCMRDSKVLELLLPLLHELAPDHNNKQAISRIVERTSNKTLMSPELAGEGSQVGN